MQIFLTLHPLKQKPYFSNNLSDIRNIKYFFWPSISAKYSFMEIVGVLTLIVLKYLSYRVVKNQFQDCGLILFFVWFLF